MTSFKVFYGRDPPPLLWWVEEESKIEEVNTIIRERNLILDDLKSNLNRAQERMKKFSDKKRREMEFAMGDYVFLKLQPYRFRSLASRINEKLSSCYYGPYEVLERIGKVAYKPRLPRFNQNTSHIPCLIAQKTLRTECEESAIT